MEIRRNHLRASFEADCEAGLDDLKPMKLNQNNMTYFCSSKRKKKQTRKNGQDSANETARNVIFSHEIRFVQGFRRNPFARNEVRPPKPEVKLSV